MAAPIEISVIIPVLNEEAHLDATLSAIGKSYSIEVIVVDGGSLDDTIEIARSHGAQVLHWEPGRATQMNAGATQARGERFLFIHGDVRLPKDWMHQIKETLAKPGVAVGAFRFATDHDTWSMRMITFATNLRSKWRHMPYGDQGLFVRASTFNKLEGFPNLALMEDYAFVRRLQREGRIATLPLKAICSGRRWRDMGPWRCMLRNQRCMLAYRLGISPDRIMQWYYGSVK